MHQCQNALGSFKLSGKKLQTKLNSDSFRQGFFYPINYNDWNPQKCVNTGVHTLRSRCSATQTCTIQPSVQVLQHSHLLHLQKSLAVSVRPGRLRPGDLLLCLNLDSESWARTLLDLRQEGGHPDIPTLVQLRNKPKLQTRPEVLFNSSEDSSCRRWATPKEPENPTLEDFVSIVSNQKESGLKSMVDLWPIIRIIEVFHIEDKSILWTWTKSRYQLFKVEIWWKFLPND